MTTLTLNPEIAVGGTIVSGGAAPGQAFMASTASAGGWRALVMTDVSDITAAGRALLDDESVADQRTTLGLGTSATKDASGNATEVATVNPEAIPSGNLTAWISSFGTENLVDSGIVASTVLIKSAIATGTITPRADDVDLSGGSDGDVWTVQSDGSLAFETPAGGAESPLVLTSGATDETPLTIEAIAGQTAPLLRLQDSTGVDEFAFSRVSSDTVQVASGSGVHFIRFLPSQSHTFSIVSSHIQHKADVSYLFRQNTTGSVRARFDSSATLNRIDISGGGTASRGIRIDDDGTAGNTRLLLWDVDAGALVRVSVGADDSGGSGFKLLRIPN